MISYTEHYGRLLNKCYLHVSNKNNWYEISMLSSFNEELYTYTCRMVREIMNPQFTLQVCTQFKLSKHVWMTAFLVMCIHTPHLPTHTSIHKHTQYDTDALCNCPHNVFTHTTLHICPSCTNSLHFCINCLSTSIHYIYIYI